MAQRVLAAGWPLWVWARRSDAVQPLVAGGAVRANEPEQLARECAFVMTIVAGTDDVIEIQRRLLPHARAGTTFIDLTTAAPAVAETLGKLAAGTGAEIMDCPVTGGVGGALQGRLTAFAGGDGGTLSRSLPLLESFSQRVVHCGPNGAGYRMKLVNQTMMAGALLGLAEGAALARAVGFGAELLKEALSRGTASGFLLNSYLQRMVDGDGPVTFTLAMLHKDLRLARAEAQRAGSTTTLIDCALAAVQSASRRHGDAAGVQCLAGGAYTAPN